MKQQSTTKGFAILSAAGMIVKVMSLLYIPLMIYIVGDEGYGIYAAAYQVYAFVFVLTNSGIPTAISKMVSELTAVGNYKDAVKGFKIARFALLIIGVLMTGMLLVFAAPLSNGLNYKKAYYSLLALSPAILFTSIASAYRGYFQGRGNMTPTAVSQVIEQVVNTVFSVILAAYFMRFGLEKGVAGSAIGTSIAALASAAFLVYYYEKNKKFKVSNVKVLEGIKRLSTNQLVRRIFKYGVPITICIGMTYAGNLVDVYNTKARLMVGGFSDSQASILYSYLAKYQQLLNVPIAIITSLAAAILPAISAVFAKNEREKVKEKINYSMRVCFLIAVPSAIGLAVLSAPVYNLLKLRSGAYIMAYGSIVVVLMGVMQIQTSIMQGIGRIYIATTYAILGIICKITVNYLLIANPKINILGAICGSIVGFLIPVILNNKVIKNTLKINLKLSSHAVKPFIASAFMGVVMYIINYDLLILFSLVKKGYVANAFALMIAGIIGIYVYIFALILTGEVRKKDLEAFPKKFMRFIPNFMLRRIR
jgi:stage V sporulation protein B